MTTSGALFIEPYYGGSHKQLIDLLVGEFHGELYTLPATKWHWRMRTSALHFSMVIARKHSYRSVFASSVLNLCELVSLRPDLANLHKVLYFHENQLVYPVRKHQDRDFQYGYNQILSCLVADTILFNSEFNLTSFLDSIDLFLKLIPDHRPKGLALNIKGKCHILYFPLEHQSCYLATQVLVLSMGSSDPVTCNYGNREYEQSCDCVQTVGGKRNSSHSQNALQLHSPSCKTQTTLPSATHCDIVKVQSSSTTDSVSDTVCSEHEKGQSPLHIVWPHRWEHDKGPHELATVLNKLLEAELEFSVSVLGAHTNDIPASFSTLFPLLGPRLLHRGQVPRSVYWDVLRNADVVLSTAKHEFFGVAMLEAVACGCYPLCPNQLVYPEFYPVECLYNTEQQLFKKLKRFCQHPHLARGAGIFKQMPIIELCKWETLKLKYAQHLNALPTVQVCND